MSATAPIHQHSQHESQINVAILGAGGIAHTMARTLLAMSSDERYSSLINPYAVAARDRDRAAAFAEQYGLPVSYGSYEDLVADPNVDLVYIATPHSLHAEQSLLCLEAGKNILVEKSFTANARQAQQVFDLSESKGLLCTEAIWTRYMPSRGIIDEVIASGEIGEVVSATANLGYPITAHARLVDPALAGGALLDVGVYPLNFLDMALQGRDPSRIASAYQPYSTGVDAQSSTTLFYDDGIMAVASSSMLGQSDRKGCVWGTSGVMVCENINDVSSITVYGPGYEVIKEHPIPDQLTGYEYEVASAAHAVLEGRQECPEMPHSDTLRIMRMMDEIRGIWGVRYPFE
ncbi:MAG: Gfo/Idh/MocA family oxidoreductase [Bifidobacterium psychraerophilum]|uniref:Gfo/Idh/MocA family protein n=1 Tax=Bifidobacterium psychraerophilum TaxID=218140 RepID=UPI0039E872F1